jgi:ATP-binding cassette subfamily F protein 3
VLELDGGALRDWPGNLSDYLARKGFAEAAAAKNVPDRIPVELATDGRFKSKEQKRAEADIRNRMSVGLRQIRDRVNELQNQVESREKRKNELEAALADEALYRDPDKCKLLMTEYQKVRQELPGLVNEWAEAAQEFERIERAKRDELKTNLG